MSKQDRQCQRAEIDVGRPIWDQFYMVSPLIVVGTTEPTGEANFAPKHLAMPMGWENYFGFMCTPRHSTYANIVSTNEFTVSVPRPSQLLFASLAAAPRSEGEKPVLQAFDTVAATQVAGEFIADSYVFLECKLHQIVEGFGDNSLITGRVVAAMADRDAIRVSDSDDQALISHSPLLAFLQPDRFAEISESIAFPYPAGMQK